MSDLIDEGWNEDRLSTRRREQLEELTRVDFITKEPHKHEPVRTLESQAPIFIPNKQETQ